MMGVLKEVLGEVGLELECFGGGKGDLVELLLLLMVMMVMLLWVVVVAALGKTTAVTLLVHSAMVLGHVGPEYR